MIKIKIDKKDVISEIKVEDVLGTLNSKKYRKKIINSIKNVYSEYHIDQIKHYASKSDDLNDLLQYTGILPCCDAGRERSDLEKDINKNIDNTVKIIDNIITYFAIPDDITDNQKGTVANWLKTYFVSWENSRRLAGLYKIDLDEERHLSPSARLALNLRPLISTHRNYEIVLSFFENNVRTFLERFFQFKDFIPEDTDFLPEKSKDLMSYIGIAEIRDAVEAARPYYDQYLQRKAHLDVEAGKENIYEDDNWKVYAVHNKGTACELGKGTDWCTAAPGLNYFERYYSEKDPLFVFINKKDPTEKYQFHYGTEQFMDKDDHPVSFEQIIVPLHHMLLEGGADEKYPIILGDIAGRNQVVMPEPNMYKKEGDYLVVKNRIGTKYYYKNGRMHNEDGPAIIPKHGEGEPEYWLDGQKRSFFSWSSLLGKEEAEEEPSTGSLRESRSFLRISIGQSNSSLLQEIKVEDVLQSFESKRNRCTK